MPPGLAYECRPEKNRFTPNRFISMVANPSSAIHVAVVRLTLGVARACRYHAYTTQEMNAHTSLGSQPQ
jgi:hypothetical protein